MKQHVSMKKINELSEKGKKALLTWWKPEWWHLFIWTDEGRKNISGDGGLDREAMNMLWTNYTTDKTDNERYKYLTDQIKKGWILPILSIGQMIAFLADQKVDSKNFKGNIPVNRLICDAEANHIVIAWNDTELSDALWQVVKEVLE